MRYRVMAWKVKEQSNTMAIAFLVTAWEMLHSKPSLEAIFYQERDLTALKGLGKLHGLQVDAITLDGVEGQRAKRHIGYCVSLDCLGYAVLDTIHGGYFLSSV